VRFEIDFKCFEFDFFRREVRLAHTVDEMYTFNQIDDHITTLIQHSHHPNMKKAKEIIEKVEFRGRIKILSPE